MKKAILFFALVVSFAMLIPAVSAETYTNNYNDKWAFAWGWSEGSFFKISADAEHAFIVAHNGGWQFFWVDLEKGDFKWSMDHVTLTFTIEVAQGEEVTRTIVWDTCGPTKTKHYNEKFDMWCMNFHFVSNCKWRPACVSVYNECGIKVGCGYGNVNHGTGNTVVSF